MIPKQGTLERIVLDALIENKEGVTFLDFPPELGITDESLAQIIENLRNGMYESEQDRDIKFDA